MFAANRSFGLVGLVICVASAATALAAPEACCFDPTGCLNLEPGDCTLAGGFAQGPASVCSGVDCASSGSCCESGGGCSDGLSGLICTDAGGTYHGNGTSCQGAESSCGDGIDNDCDGDVDCADADCASSSSCTGACCNADGTCDDGESAGSCTGTYQGDGTDCGSVSCPEATGACCLTGGSCLELTLGNCDVVPNSGWAGPFTTCGGAFPAEDNQALCCDGYDNDCDGFTDLADASCAAVACVQAPAIAPAPHDRVKNRYVSFTPSNGGLAVAYRVTIVDNMLDPMAIGHSCWVGVPVAAGAFANSATCSNNPVFRVWTESVVHVGDCEIIPKAIYEVSATENGVNFSTPLAVETATRVNFNGKNWGDTVGMNNGVEWTPPNGLVNVHDLLAALALISNAVPQPDRTAVNLIAINVSDSCLNVFVGTADVLASVRAIAGDSYGPPSTIRITDPALCALAPGMNCPCCGN